MRFLIAAFSMVMVLAAILVASTISGEHAKIGYSLVAGLFAIAAAIATTDASPKGDCAAALRAQPEKRTPSSTAGEE